MGRLCASITSKKDMSLAWSQFCAYCLRPHSHTMRKQVCAQVSGLIEWCSTHPQPSTLTAETEGLLRLQFEPRVATIWLNGSPFWRGILWVGRVYHTSSGCVTLLLVNETQGCTTNIHGMVLELPIHFNTLKCQWVDNMHSTHPLWGGLAWTQISTKRCTFLPQQPSILTS